MVEEAAVWCAVHGLVVGDRADPRSGTVPGVGLVHAPFSLLPARFPASFWKQACELAPIFNELVDRVSLDGEFLQAALSRTKQVDEFTARLLEIHEKMKAINKKEDIRLGLHRSDYMLDSETNSLLQIELNTISSSFPGLGSLVSELHRTLLNHYGKVLGLDSKRIPRNWAATQFAEALGKAWAEYNNDSAVVLMVVQPEERNMYDQYWLVSHLKESYGVTTIRKTLAQVEAEGQVLTDGTLVIDGRAVAVVYFRAGYAPADYPSEAEWRARLLMEQSSAIKCPSISYHLVGTKKIQQELAKPNVLERFLDNKEDIAKLRKSFAGLWSLDNEEIVKSAIEKPDLFVLKPQREGGGNNIYGHDLRDMLIKLQKEQGESLAAYILMQRIFPKASLTPLVRGGDCFEDLTISELGIYGAYLRNKDKVILNNQSGYLMRTKVSSSNEGGVAAGFAVLDSILLTDEAENEKAALQQRILELEAEIEQRAQKDRASEEPASHHGSTTQPNQFFSARNGEDDPNDKDYASGDDDDQLQSSKAATPKTDAPRSPHDALIGKDVILYALLRANVPVAKGTIVSTKPDTIVGGEPIGRQYCEVIVTCVLKRDEVLPRPYGNMQTMADTRMRRLAWPYKKLKVTNKAPAGSVSRKG